MAQVNLAGLTLHVADLERSVEFYRRLPGAEVRVFQPGLFAMVTIGRGRIGLLQRAAGRFHVELEVADLDAYYEEVHRPASSPRARRSSIPGASATSWSSTPTGSTWNSRRARRATLPLRPKPRGTTRVQSDNVIRELRSSIIFNGPTESIATTGNGVSFHADRLDHRRRGNPVIR